MGEQKLKTSLFGGFKKAGVLDYIEQLQAEIVRLKSDNSGVSSVSEELNLLKEENEADNKLIEQLKAENSSIIEQNATYALRLEEAQATIEEYERKQKIWEEKISLIENRFAEIENGYSRLGTTDSKINNLMIDAMSYPDRRFAGGVTSADSISGKASAVIREARSDIYGANERIKTACINFESSTASLRASAENLLRALDSLADQVES